MSKITVFLQHDGGKLLKATKVAITAAKELTVAWGGGELVGIALGAGAAQAAAAAAGCGLAQVVFCEAAHFERYLAEQFAPAVAAALQDLGSTSLVFPATSLGKDLAPCVAAILEAGQASDVIAINSDGTLRRPMYAGNVIADVQITTQSRVVTVRPSAFAACSEGTPNSTGIRQLNLSPTQTSSEVLSYEGVKAERPELGDAEVVVSGGRALQSAENFEKVLFPLADSLGAAIGASRAAVDSGYAPNDWQVGQTGKVVAPRLYFAIGISGAIQHLAGMKDSKVIVAINKDPDAPVFEVADYGLVGDLFTEVPKIVSAIKASK